MNESLSTKRFFESHHIKLSDYWLESCIQWYKEENPNLNYSLETLHSVVYAQWLLLDLRDVEVCILPPNLVQFKKTVLHNKYCLQILHVQDISQPKLTQIQKIRNPNVLVDSKVNYQEQQFNTGSKRMLQLLLTDGVQEIHAIEYKPIKILNANLKPGTKIKISGPVQVRRGQIMLEEKNTSLLGGEVDELLISNAYENVLARALQLPENPQPNIVEEEVTPINPEVIVNNRQVQSNIEQYLTGTIQRGSNNNPASVVSTEPSINFDKTITDEVDMLLEVERDMAADLAAFNGLDIKKHLDEDDSVFLEAERKISTECVDLTKESPEKIPNDSIFEDMDIDSHLDLIDKQENDYLKNSLNKIVSIASLLENKAAEGEFIIRAKFKKVVQKLTVTDDGWLLKLLIEDESGDLEVKVDSTVVSNLIGYDHSAVMAIRKNIVNKDESVTTVLMKGIEELRAKIMEINGEMVIQFSSTEQLPIITKIK